MLSREGLCRSEILPTKAKKKRSPYRGMSHLRRRFKPGHISKSIFVQKHGVTVGANIIPYRSTCLPCVSVSLSLYVWGPPYVELGRSRSRYLLPWSRCCVGCADPGKNKIYMSFRMLVCHKDLFVRQRRTHKTMPYHGCDYTTAGAAVDRFLRGCLLTLPPTF